MADDKKRYNYMENVLQQINRKFVSLPEAEVQRNNNIIKELLTALIRKMCHKDALFKKMYSRTFYGGSYYDGLRVGKPEEYDLDLLLVIPKLSDPVITTSNVPGFVHLQIQDYDKFIKQPEFREAYLKFGTLLDDRRYLDTGKVLAWVEGVLHKALNDYPKVGKERIIKLKSGEFQISMRKGGPALTIHLVGHGCKMDIDFVTCFVFGGDKWPRKGFRPNNVPSKPQFFIVPKSPKTSEGPTSIYWRLSFQEQERVLIDNMCNLKPTVKLLKKLRSTQGFDTISSYYIKTAILWISEQRGPELWQNSLSYAFMTSLKDFAHFIEEQKIGYYWNQRNNLLGNMSEVTLDHISNRLNVIIKDIEQNSSDPKVVAKYLLDSSEYTEFMELFSSTI